MRRRLAVAAAAVLGAAGAACAAAGCLDATPVSVQSTLFDASADADDGATAAMCNACVQAPDQPGPGCGSEQAACSALPVCKATVECATRAFCFERGSLGALEQCGLPCAIDSGIVLGDPAYTASLQVFSCVLASCGSACGLSEAGR
jgi:hypothetical protein